MALAARKPEEPPRYGRGTGNPHPVDVHVGKRLRLRRLYGGFNQEELGAALGLTFQQIQKYEGGANRLGASRLKDAADFLGVPVGWFFEGLAPDGTSLDDPAIDPHLVEFARLYEAIADPVVRRAFFVLVVAAAGMAP